MKQKLHFDFENLNFFLHRGVLHWLKIIKSWKKKCLKLFYFILCIPVLYSCFSVIIDQLVSADQNVENVLGVEIQSPQFDN